MLLTLSTTPRPATDLGYLLRKHPARAQSFDLSFGKAHVFYSEAGEERCTVGLLVEVDPVGLVRNRRGPAGDGSLLEQYVNDRPYAASSFLSVAIGEVFGTALAGSECKDRPGLSDTPLPLIVGIPALPCRGGEAFLRRLFEPLGYQIEATRLPVAIVLDRPERVAHERSQARPDRDFGPHVIRQQAQQLHRSLRGLEREGFRRVHVLKSPAEVEAAEIVRELLWNNRKFEHGPFDIVGDVHGCFDELVELLGLLGYTNDSGEGVWRHAAGRKLVFLGDLVDRGPKIPPVLDDGKLVVAHAGLKESMQGRGSGAVREFALFGETTGETDEFGLPVRFNWAAEYRGEAMVVYGHTPVPKPEWLNRTIDIDTGCVFGGKLTALRYPEKELFSVPARQAYAEPRKPFLAPEVQVPTLSAQQQYDDLLDFADVGGKRSISTRLHGNVTIRDESIFGSFTARNTARPRTWSGCAHAG